MGPRLQLAAAALLLLTACGGGGGDSTSAPPTQTNNGIASVAITPANPVISLGGSVALTATGYDSKGNALPGSAAIWTSANTDVATVLSSGVVTGLHVGSAIISANVNGVVGTTTVTVQQIGVASVTIQGNTGASLSIGQTLQLVAVPKDASGNALTGRTITWNSSNTGVATVSANGLATAVGAGTATITATSEGVSGTTTLTVGAAAVATVTVAPSAATIAASGTQQLSATMKDASGNTLNGRSVAWTSSNTGVATVSAAGLVTGVAAGTAIITATSEGKTGSSTITVTAGGGGSGSGSVAIASVSPALLTPGITATIAGSGFAVTPGLDTVKIDGVAALVSAASATQLTVTVPTSLPCVPTHAATVRVAVGTAVASGSQQLRVGVVRSLSVGASFVITNPTELACTELPGGTAHYVMSVVNTSQVPTGVAAFRLSGATTAPSGARAGLSRAPGGATFIRQPLAGRRMPALPPGGAAPLGNDPAMHLRVLETNRALYPRLRAAFGAARRGAGTRPSLSRAGMAAIPAIGTKKTFRVNQFQTTLNASGGCGSYVAITARLVYVGTKTAIWEDVAAPLAGTMDSYFTKVGQEFDATMYRSDSTYFGDPLVTDPYTDQDQHLHMVFTPSVPKGLAGFVISCDFFQRDSTNDPSSNFGEYFYAYVPTTAGTGFSAFTPDQWLRVIRTTIVHEVKHIASMGARLVNHAASYEESWLEEGTARHAEEVWLRDNIYHTAWKGNATYAQSAYCDVRPSWSQCTGAPLGIFNHFATLYSNLGSQGATSLFGRVADNDFAFYANSWSFVRWADDRYASSDAAFLRGLTQATQYTGTANIAAQTGRPVDEMLGNWTLSLNLDDNSIAAQNRDVDDPTWNTHSVYAGMNQDFPSSYPAAFPLAPQALTMSNFAVDNAGIHGGSFAMYDLSGSTTNGQTIGLGGYNGSGSASTALRIAIARLQ